VLAPGTLVVDMTSNDPNTTRRAVPRLARKGIDLVDAPVAGGKSAGEQGTLAIAVGGSQAGFERARPYLEQVSSLLLHVGDVGAGDVCKLAHNLGIHIIRQALAEMFTLAVKAGVKPEVLFDFVSTGAFGRLDQLHSWFRPRILTGDFMTGEPTFRLALGLKDIALAVSLADDLEMPLPLGRECLDIARAASTRGWGERDAWISFAVQEERAGVVVRSDPDRAASA
jgi:3-hydroxyisobutyrate dehydrogenase